MEKTRHAPEGMRPLTRKKTGLPTKVCPMCGQLLFADMDVCYGCLHDFRRKEPPAYGLSPTAFSGRRTAGFDEGFADLDELPEATDRGGSDREEVDSVGSPYDSEVLPARGRGAKVEAASVGPTIGSPRGHEEHMAQGQISKASGATMDPAAGFLGDSEAHATRGRAEKDPGIMTDSAIEGHAPGPCAQGGPVRESVARASCQPGAFELRASGLRAPNERRAPNVSLAETSRGGGLDGKSDASGDIGLRPATATPTRYPELSCDDPCPHPMPEVPPAAEGVRGRQAGGTRDVSHVEPEDGSSPSEVMTELIEESRRGPFLLRLQTQDLAVDVEVGPEGLLVGRAGDCDLVIHRRSVSRRHVRISRTGSGLSAMDQGATNPARIDDVPLQGCAPLLPGSTLDVCGVRLVHPA